MKINKSILIVSIVLLIVILSIFSLNEGLYTHKLNNRYNSKWTNTSCVSRWGNSNELLPNPSYSIVVKYNEMLIGDIDSHKPIIIDISNCDFGLLWLPLVQKSKYQFSTIIEDSQTIIQDSATFKIEVHGKINLSGDYLILGTCSYQKAKSLVIEKTMNKIYKDAKVKIK